MFYDITTEQIDEIRDFVESGGALPAKDTVIRFNALHAALNKKMYEELAKSRSKATRLEKRVQNLKAREEDRAAAGMFTETVPGLDSLEVAKALAWCLRQKQAHSLNNTKIVAILYEMYSSWLESKHERLFAHHPQATSYGPQFWRVWKKLNVNAVVYGDFSTLAEKNAGIAAFCRNAAEKYYDWKLSDLVEPSKKSAPYRNALPEHNDGKWNAEISDADIYEWRIRNAK